MRALACRMTAMNIRLCTPSALAFVVVVGCAGHVVGSGTGGNDLSSAGGATSVGGSSSGDAAASADGAGATCPRDRSDPAGKFSAVDQRWWEANAGPDSVMITVRGGAVLSPFPPCPSRPLSCPEKDRMIALWQAENAAAQRCVRQLVAEVGGTVPPAEIFWLVNIFRANLTWAEIQIVATHPDVVQIGGGNAGTVPPPTDGGPA